MYLNRALVMTTRNYSILMHRVSLWSIHLNSLKFSNDDMGDETNMTGFITIDH